ncbi:unnamed protein product [Caenorhabditis sp. 36 PRJEB53466]|nr:unnamed protein product [Caenorhabditis sp. 36 PRJEB53466]
MRHKVQFRSNTVCGGAHLHHFHVAPRHQRPRKTKQQTTEAFQQQQYGDKNEKWYKISLDPRNKSLLAPSSTGQGTKTPEIIGDVKFEP